MKKPDYRTIIAILIVLSGVGYLVISGVSQTGVYYRTVSEVLDGRGGIDETSLRISGNVVDDTIDYSQERLKLSFDVSDTEDDTRTMRAVYNGFAPDQFEGGIEVVLEGSYDRDTNTFNAVTLLAKCPSKYVAEELAGKEK